MNDNYYKIIEKYGHLKVRSAFGNLSDNLFLTPLVKKNPNLEIEMGNEEVHLIRARVFENLIKVTHKDQSELIPPIPFQMGKTHISQAILDYFGIDDINYIPLIKLTEDEINWAKDFLKPYENPLALMPTNSCSWDKNNYLAQVKTFTPEMCDFFIQNFGKKYTILQFGVESGYYKTMKAEFSPINGVIHLKNLNVRQLAACYHVIGKIISCDTGDPYLMIAVGGKVLEVVPMNVESIYRHWEYTYSNESLWKGEKIRAKYFDLKDYKKTLDYIDFNF
jgi:hypothetical protein